MSPLTEITRELPELTAIRRDLHQNPELGFEVYRTADLVARELRRIGLDVTSGIGQTGIIATLRKGSSPRSVGLRADMDALPIEEENDLPYRSKASKCMHACGHDGHTTLLLGAARYLARSGSFDGTIHFIFQPAEETLSGSKAMIDDGLFERFPCDAVFGIHNRPGLEVGRFSIRSGAMFAGGASFRINVTGRASHGARPEDSIDPVLTAAHIAVALQSIISRNIPPAQAAVLSVTQIAGGEAFNTIPQCAQLGGTVRAYSMDILSHIESRMRALTTSVAAGFGATAALDFKLLAPPVVNDDISTTEMIEAAKEIGGADSVSTSVPFMASDDFSYMIEKCSGAYMNVGITNGAHGAALLHTPQYDFNDEAIPFGAELLVRVSERRLSI